MLTSVPANHEEGVVRALPPPPPQPEMNIVRTNGDATRMGNFLNLGMELADVGNPVRAGGYSAQEIVTQPAGFVLRIGTRQRRVRATQLRGANRRCQLVGKTVRRGRRSCLEI